MIEGRVKRTLWKTWFSLSYFTFSLRFRFFHSISIVTIKWGKLWTPHDHHVVVLWSWHSCVDNLCSLRSRCIGWQKIYEYVICNLRLTPDELGALFAVAQLANWAVGRYSSEIWQIWQFRMASLVSFDSRLVPATIVIAVYNAMKIDVKILFMKIYMCELLYSFLFNTIRCYVNTGVFRFL